MLSEPKARVADLSRRVCSREIPKRRSSLRRQGYLGHARRGQTFAQPRDRARSRSTAGLRQGHKRPLNGSMPSLSSSAQRARRSSIPILTSTTAACRTSRRYRDIWSYHRNYRNEETSLIAEDHAAHEWIPLPHLRCMCGGRCRCSYFPRQTPQLRYAWSAFACPWDDGDSRWMLPHG